MTTSIETNFNGCLIPMPRIEQAQDQLDEMIEQAAFEANLSSSARQELSRRLGELALPHST